MQSVNPVNVYYHYYYLFIYFPIINPGFTSEGNITIISNKY